MKKNLIRTYPIKSLTIFLTIAFLVSLSMIILFIFLTEEPMLIRVLIWIFCGLFLFASTFMLCNQLFFYIAVDDEYFKKYAFLSVQKIPLKKIEKVRNKDGFYFIYVQGRKICSFATNTKEGQEIVVFLEKKGVKIEW